MKNNEEIFQYEYDHLKNLDFTKHILMESTTIQIGIKTTKIRCSIAPEKLTLVGFLPSNRALVFDEIAPVDVSESQILRDLAPVLVQEDHEVLLFGDHDYILRVNTIENNSFIYFLGYSQSSLFKNDSSIISYSNFTKIFNPPI